MKRLALRSIRTKLLLAFGVLALGPLIVLGLLATSEGTRELEAAAASKLQRLSTATAATISAYLDERTGDAAVFATNPIAAKGTPDEVTTLADRLVGIYDQYDVIVVTDADGAVIASNTVSGDHKPVDRASLLGKSMKGQPWFDAIAGTQIPHGGVYQGDVQIDPLIAQVSHGPGQGFVSSIGIYDATGKLVRVWSNHVSWERSIGGLVKDALGRAKAGGITTAQIEVTNKAGTVIDDEDASRMMKKDLAAGAPEYVLAALAGQAGSVHAVDSRDGKDAVIGYAPVRDSGNYKSTGWAVFLHEAYAEVAEETKGLRNFSLLVVGIALLFVVLGALFVARGLSRPMRSNVETLQRVASGDLTARATVTGQDELAEMGTALNAALDRLSDAFQTIGEGVLELGQSSSDLSNIGSSLNASADETSRQAGVVAAASEQAGKNVQTVASGTEEMSVTIKEIAKNAAAAARVATSAVSSAQRTNELVAKLGESSTEIGNVLKVITTIAEQTNLLALNATIEAARAGEAGKGFAVVANEVKELAKETAKATEDITRKIAAIQSDTTSAISAIAEITQVIGEINDIQNTIASSVEEQAATTNEIGRNLHELAQASNEIAQNVTSVAAAAGSTADASTQTRNAAANLSELSRNLDTQMRQFTYQRTDNRAPTPEPALPRSTGGTLVRVPQPVVVPRPAKSLGNGQYQH